MGITIPQRGVIQPKFSLISGRGYGHRSAYPGTPTTAALVIATAAATPFYVPATGAVDLISINVTTNVAASHCWLSVYDSTPAGMPGALLAHSGTLDTATTGIKSAAIAATLVAGVRYWLSVNADTAGISVTASLSSSGELGYADAADATNRMAVYRALAYATPPASWGTRDGFTSVHPHILVRAV